MYIYIYIFIYINLFIYINIFIYNTFPPQVKHPLSSKRRKTNWRRWRKRRRRGRSLSVDG